MIQFTAAGLLFLQHNLLIFSKYHTEEYMTVVKIPEDFIGKNLKKNFKELNYEPMDYEIAEGIRYAQLPALVCDEFIEDKRTIVFKFGPKDLDEHGEFYWEGAMAYSVYISADLKNVIEEVNCLINQTQCSHHSRAPHSATAWLFPQDAMFSVEFEDIPEFCQERIIQLLTEMTEV